jgi:hypothetical protein
MRKTALILFGALLVAGSAIQMASATTEHHARKHRMHATSEQLLNANNAVHANAACQKEGGNPYDRETDYWSWSAWQEGGAWDGHADCR